jgi:hypothetical protein
MGDRKIVNATLWEKMFEDVDFMIESKQLSVPDCILLCDIYYKSSILDENQIKKIA